MRLQTSARDRRLNDWYQQKALRKCAENFSYNYSAALFPMQEWMQTGTAINRIFSVPNDGN
jgi:hypothetical protein